MAATVEQGAPEITGADTAELSSAEAPASPEAQAPPAAKAPAPAGRSAKTVAKELRRARGRRLAVRLGIFVLVPTLLASAYYGSIASDQYESYSLFTIHSAEARPTLGLESLIGGMASGANSRDVLAVRDYVLSRDMLGRLNKEHGFIPHYQAGSVDWLSRLERDASFEDAYKYFDHKVMADFDTTSGTLTLRVRAFSAEKAVELSRAILTYSEEMVNKLSERERSDMTQHAESEVSEAEKRLANARKVILALQQKHGDLNPLQTATSAMTIRTELEGELAKAKAELMQLKAFMKDDAPLVQAARERVNSIAAQVSQESRRLVDPKRPDGLNASLADFDAAMVEKEFAQKAYESAMATLEIARSDADRQHRYLATIAAPSKPDESTFPRRILGVVTVFVVSFLLMGVGTMMSAAVREHARL